MEIVKDEPQITNEVFQKSEVLPSKTSPVYDPTKSYTWGPKDFVPMTGMEFANILNSIRTILSSPEAQKIMLAQKASNSIESVLSKMVGLEMATEQPTKN